MALDVPQHPFRPGDLLVVVHEFDARTSDELTLRRGDKIELIELEMASGMDGTLEGMWPPGT